MTGQEVFGAFLLELQNGIGNQSVMIMIAGPNGVGKTTFWNAILRPKIGFLVGDNYINADEIERDFHPDGYLVTQQDSDAKRAQSEATYLRNDLINRKPPFQEHFAYETVFSDQANWKLNELKAGIANNYYVVMIFIGVSDVELAKTRVAARVAKCGHNVTLETQDKRFPNVFKNAKQAIDIVHLALFMDNSKDIGEGGGTHRPVAVYSNGRLVGHVDPMPTWWVEKISSS